VTGSHGFDEKQFAQGPLLPDDVRTWARNLVPKAAPPPPPPPPKKEEPALKPMQMGAIAAGGVGAVALIAGVALAATNNGVLEDAGSTGDEKEGARTMGWVGVGSTVVGVAALGAGAGLFFLE
jgi:hypothetical protein